MNHIIMIVCDLGPTHCSHGNTILPRTQSYGLYPSLRQHATLS